MAEAAFVVPAAAFYHDASAFGVTGSAFCMAASASCSAALAFCGFVMVTVREKADALEDEDAAGLKKAVARWQKDATIKKQVTSNLFSDVATLGRTRGPLGFWILLGWRSAGEE